MEHISELPNSIFVGQAVLVPGTAMSNTLKDIDNLKLFEMPVAEEMQMGISIGLALKGYLPISVYPRWNFLFLAMNQLVNHLDKIQDYSDNGFKPKVIIRTSVGSIRPLNPQIQHTGDFSESFKKILKNIDIKLLKEPEDIYIGYKNALRNNNSTILVEYGDYYNEK